MPATAAGTHNYCRTLATVGLVAAETIEASQTSIAEGRLVTARTPATVEFFGGIREKLVRKVKNSWKKTQKE
jgi:hypothetical protein